MRVETLLGSFYDHDQEDNLVKLAIARGDRIKELEADNKAQLEHIERLQEYIKRIEKRRKKK